MNGKPCPYCGNEPPTGHAFCSDSCAYLWYSYGPNPNPGPAPTLARTQPKRTTRRQRRR